MSVRRPLISQFSSKAQSAELGYGALETVLRFILLDFIDSNTPVGPLGQTVGGQVPQLTVGMNWYLADRLRVMLDYSYAVPKDATAGSSSVSVFQLRVGFFW